MENVIDFVTKFAASFETPVNEEAEEEEDDDEDDNGFLNFLFNFLLEVVSLICRHLGWGKIISHSVPLFTLDFLSISFSPSVSWCKQPCGAISCLSAGE